MTKESKDCTGFCPECGYDVAYNNLECQCKNPDCNWSCSDCKNTAENISSSDSD